MAEAVILNHRYQLQEQQAEGGMAVVYRAYDLSLERFVAIKILHKEFSSDPELRDQFRQEAKAVANLSHPNIVTVHDFGLDADRLFLVMEFVPGTDLKTILRRRGAMPQEEALALFIQGCAGIGYAHRAGIIHCDVKPQNMLVTPDQIVKVVDFGIARVLAALVPGEQMDVIWGSPQYISPEQVSGGAPSPASDVYSLGVVLYEMLTGQLPFKGGTPEELIHQHREVPPPSPRKINPDISPALEGIILKILSKEPSARYRTADQLRHLILNLTAADPSGQIIYPAAKPNTAGDLLPPQILPTPISVQVPAAQNARPAAQSSKSAPTARPAAVIRKRSNRFDWLTWLLVFFALLAVGGLVPFWLWVYGVLNLR